MVCSWSGSNRAHYRWDAAEAVLSAPLLDPRAQRTQPDTRLPVVSTARPEHLWKLNWFLRDFGYDTELLGRDEIDEKSLVGLRGVVKISHVVVNGTSLLNLDGFAPASQWEELSSASPATAASPEVAR